MANLQPHVPEETQQVFRERAQTIGIIALRE